MNAALAEKVAIVTGGSSGIGRAVCLALAEAGAHVVAVGRHAERLAQTAALLHGPAAAHGTRIETLALDVQSEADMEAMAARTRAGFGRIDALVCAAGIARPVGQRLQPVAQTPAEFFDTVLATNLKGIFLGNRAVLPDMLAEGTGDIVNVASAAALAGVALSGAYCASKAGVVGLSEALAAECAPQGVRVQAVLPGPFETEIWGQAGARLRLGTQLPPARRVADTIRFLLSLPPDTRLVAPVVQPLDRAVGGSVLGGAGKRATSSSVLEAAMTSESKPAARLEGKVVIVTGGTGGLGFATCRAAAHEGAAVVVADLNLDQVRQCAAQLPGSHPVGHLGYPMDVRSEADNENLVRITLERYGRIDALVACAGILRLAGTPPKPLVKTTVAEWDAVLGINLKGVFLGNRAVVPVMIKQRYGTIINVSSVSGLKGRANDGPYCASKFGVIGLSQALADEVRTYGVRVQAIMPDALATPFWAQNHPIPPPGDALPPERVAEVIVFMLAQPEDTVLVGPVVAPLGARKRTISAKAKAETSATETPP